MAGSAHDKTFDAVVVGAGVVGCAVTRALAMAGASVALTEKAPDILDGASKANSAILHTGFDAPPGSLEQRCIAAGYAEYLAIRDNLGLPLDTSAALVIAWTDEEEATLPTLIDQAHANGVTDVEPLGRAALHAVEPNLGPGARAAFRVPREYLIDPWSAPHAYLAQALAHGAVLLRSCSVTGGDFDGKLWTLATSQGSLRARLVINTAGLFGDHLDAALLGRTDFTIRPRKGQFVVYDKPAASLTRHILLPVPNKITKGIVVCRTIWGNLLVGPTAEEQDDRDTAALVPDTLAALKRRWEEILPALRDHEVTALYAGLRPATEFKDYQIRAHADRALVTVGGIRSTGLSAALGIAQHVLTLARDLGHDWPAPATHQWPRVRNIAETAPRDWQTPGHGGIICHCELVTRREVLDALDGPLAARSMAGLKRRTRVTMGRCQGFYCSAELARLTEERLDEPITPP